MEKLNKYKRWNLQIHLINDEYWDFVLSQDPTPFIDCSGKSLKNEDCLSSYIDFSNSDCIEKDAVVSLSGYTWDGAIADSVKLKDFGFVAMDNGKLIFDYSTATNKEFYDVITGTELEINGDTRLRLYRVSGNTYDFVYPIEYDDEEGFYTFKGGFFQGFYKLFGFDYQVLPQYIEDEWNLEFVLRPKNIQEEPKTINSKNNGKNKGIFFYMGTRAENKFAEYYDANIDEYESKSETEPCEDFFLLDLKNDEESKKRFKAEFIAFMLLSPFNCQCKALCSQCDTYEENDTYKQLVDECDAYFSDDYFEKDSEVKIDIKTSNGASIKKGGYYEIDTDNKFLTYDRTKNGLTTDKFQKDAITRLFGYVKNSNENKFLTYHRGISGKTVDNETETLFKYSIEDDILNNCFALRITDDGRIGYRYLISDCETKFKIEEEYSLPNTIKTNEWHAVNVKITALNGNIDDCGKPMGKRKIKIIIYVNGKLVFISKELPEFDFAELNEVYAKQEGVPFNISLGGGSQGLSEAVSIKTKTKFNKILPIEENFAGTFIGDIKSFRFYTCALPFEFIRNNFLYEKLMPAAKYQALYIIDGVQYTSITYTVGESINYPDIPREGYILTWNQIYNIMPDHNITINGTYIKEDVQNAVIYCGPVLSSEVRSFNDYNLLNKFIAILDTPTILSITVPPNPEYIIAEDLSEEEFNQWVEEHMFEYYILLPTDFALSYTFKNAGNADIDSTINLVDDEIVTINGIRYKKYHKIYASQDDTLQTGTIKITVTKK